MKQCYDNQVLLERMGHSSTCTVERCATNCSILMESLGHKRTCTEEMCSKNCKVALQRMGHNSDCTEEELGGEGGSQGAAEREESSASNSVGVKCSPTTWRRSQQGLHN